MELEDVENSSEVALWQRGDEFDLRLSPERWGPDRSCNRRPRSRSVQALADQMGERVMPYLKSDGSWKSRIVAALRTQEPDDHDPGKEKRFKNARRT